MKRHPFDLVSFVPGVLAVAIAVVALADGLTIDLLTTDWVWPTVLVGLGVLILASAGIGRRAPQPPATPDPEVPSEDGPAAGEEEEWPAG